MADSTVDALQPDIEFGADDLKAAKVGEVDQTAEQLTFFYAQFQLPDGLTGRNVASVNSVDLQLRRAAGSPALSLTYYVYGIFDGIDTEGATTYTWNDGVGFDPSHTLVKFLNPGNEEIFYYSDPAESALDEDCRYRGVDNLYVVDGSFMPTSAGVNPSLTIAANALRVGERLAKSS